MNFVTEAMFCKVFRSGDGKPAMSATDAGDRSNESCVYSFGYFFQPRSRLFLDALDSCSTTMTTTVM